MSQQTIGIGSAANDGTGDPLRTAFIKTNSNFDELYAINLSAYAPLASPTFTGDPKAPTPTAGDNDTSIATTAFVNTKAGNYLPLAGGTLTGNLTISSAGALVVQASTGSTSPATGALTVAGGLGVAGNIHGGDIFSQRAGATTTGVYNFGTSGSQFLYNDGTKFFFSGGPVVIQSTTASTSPTTGALTIAGGVGAQGSINAAGNIKTGTGGTLLGTGQLTVAPGGNAYLEVTDGAKSTLVGADTSGCFVGTYGSSDLRFKPNNVERGRFQADGNFVALVKGYQPGGGPWADTSDARIKAVLGDYEHGLAEVLQLAPKRYSYKGNDTNEPTTASKFPYESSPHFGAATAGTEYIGLIAQEVETVMPEMVTFATGYIDGTNKVADLRRLDTGALIFALVNSVKELSARLKVLEGGQA